MPWVYETVPEKKIFLQIPLSGVRDPYGSSSAYQQVRLFIRWLGVLMGSDFLRDDRIVLLPVTYNTNFAFLPELKNIHEYANSISSIVLSLIEQKEYFENGVTEAFANSYQRPAPSSNNNPIHILGTIEAEDLDSGGEGVAYHDSSPDNQGGVYRISEGVDLVASDGRIVVGHTNTGEWMQYTVDVAQAREYELEFSASSLNGGGKIGIEVDGESLLSGIAVPQTSDWHKYTSFTENAALVSGKQVWRVNIENGGFTVTAEASPAQLMVVNVHGQVVFIKIGVFTNSFFPINTNGVYIILLIQGDKRITQKFFVVKK